MKTIAKKILSLVFLLPFLFPAYSAVSKKKCVILLHGLARSHHSMTKLELMLRRYHYVVINQDYPSTKKSIKQLANTYLPPMINSCLKQHAPYINFVTHSMGGILVQLYLQHHTIPHLKRIVMLSPPNHGSPVADLLHDNWIFKMMTGPAGQELTTWKISTPNQLHLGHQYDIGIITGTFNFVPFLNYLFKEPNDGAVSISSAKSKMMKDFLVLHASHPFIMENTLVHQQILYFLNFGKFKHYSALIK